MPDTPQTIGTRIRVRRALLHLSLTEIGHELGVTAHAVARWEADETRRDLERFPALARLLCCDLGWLIEGDAQ